MAHSVQGPGQCPACGGNLIQKNRARLIAVGLALLCAAAAGVHFIRILWIVAVPAILVAGYLAFWGTIGKGQWCRNCKSVPLFQKTGEAR